MSREELYNKYKNCINSVENKDDLIDMLMLLEEDVYDEQEDIDLDTLFVGDKT